MKSALRKSQMVGLSIPSRCTSIIETPIVGYDDRKWDEIVSLTPGKASRDRPNIFASGRKRRSFAFVRIVNTVIE